MAARDDEPPSCPADRLSTMQERTDVAIIAFFVSYILFLLFWTVLLSLPVIAGLWLARRRLMFARPIASRRARLLLALTFAAAMFYALYYVEWFDVWRHGVPSASYLLGYSPYVLLAAMAGWSVSYLVVPRSEGAPTLNRGF